MAKKHSHDDDFVQEYLYIEEYSYYESPTKKPEEKDKQEEVERGVIIIDLL